jgi:hypothetical protein
MNSPVALVAVAWFADDATPEDSCTLTWERHEHAGCKHDLGDVVGVTPRGERLAFCVRCNFLRKVRPPRSARTWSGR